MIVPILIALTLTGTPAHEVSAPAKAAGMAGYSALLVHRRILDESDFEIPVELKPEPKPEQAPEAKPDPKPPQPMPPLVPVQPPKPAAPSKPVIPPKPQQGYWRTECGPDGCRRIWVPYGQAPTHLIPHHYERRGLFRWR